MPGLNPGEMNGHSDYGRFGPERGFTNGHFDPYSRDPYREDMRGDEDPYRRPVRNGGGRPTSDRFSNDHLADQSSLSDFNSSEPAFELDHLATFAAGGARKGTMHVEDGLRKLRQMENTTGIWTMRCILLVERRFIVILDKNSGEELERFPVQYIQEPTAIFKNDRREIYNNLILFTVMDESNKKDAQADMHIFQSVRTPAQNIVDEIFAAKRGQGRVSSGGEADLYEIFARHSIETGREVREGFYAHRQTANQNALESQAASHLSGLASASSQLVQNTSASQQSQHTSANRHSHTTSTTNQQSSSDALSPSLEARSQTVATTIQQLIATSATNTSSHLGHQQTEAKSQLYGENVTVSKAEDACPSRVRHISSGYETRIALMGRGRPPAVTNTHSEQAQNMNASEDTSRNVQSRGRHLSAGYQARIALMGDDRPFAAVANTHDKEQADLYNRLGRETGSRAAHNRSGLARQRATTNESGVEVVRMTASKQAENWHGRQELGTAGEKPPWYKIPPPPTGPAPEPPGSRDPYDFGGFRESIEHRQYNQFNVSPYGHSQFHNGGGFIGGPQRTSMMARPSYLPYREREDEIGSNELLERDVTRGDEAAAYARVQKPEKKENIYDSDLDQQLLNHCFDDIEKFVARLQQAAEAYKELERRKKERGGKGKKNVSGDGMLGHRARPPPAQDFVDIFQKFKLSFNLLAKLKAHIHDPNAPELVHFLFTPLSLIYEASRDPIHGSMNLGEQAAAPVLTQDAKQLLLNCLTSKEIELWQALGKNWTTSKDEWKGYVPPYVPRFYDGWQPAPTLVDEPAPRSNIETAVVAHHDQIRNRAQEQDVRDYVQNSVMPFPPEEERWAHRERVQDFDRFEPDPRAPSPPRNVLSNASVVGYQQYVEQHIDRNHRAHNTPRAPEPQPPAPVSQPMTQQRPLDDNTAYLEELRRTGASVYEVLHDRQGKNQKELTVNKGDYLQVLDNSRNWWKVRNYKGESGYCPYTILKEVPNTADNSRELGSSMNAAAEQTAPPLPEKKASRRGDYMPYQLPAQSEESPEAVPRYGGHFGAPSHSEEVQIPPFSLEDETDRERHAFQPVEPAHYNNRGAMGIRKTQPQDAVHNELASKMGLVLAERRGAGRGGGGGGEENYQPTMMSTAPASPPSSMSGMQPFYISQQSNQSSVATWLESKGFSTLCRQTLKGFNGRDLFSLQRLEMEQLIGHEEAARLEGQLTLQKKMTGYKTQSAAELNAIFKKRRARTDHQGAPLGLPPDFSPMAPSYDVPDSDSDGDDRHLADTGKTLRDLLIRQRRKIVSTSIFDQQ